MVFNYFFQDRGGGYFRLGWDWMQVKMAKGHDTMFIQCTDTSGI